MCDAYTGWLACYPAAQNSTEEAHFALNDFVGPTEKVGLCYSDCAPELMAAAKRLRWRHATSTPGRPETNGAAERAVRAVLEGARSLLAASGLPHSWWNHAARFWSFMHNVTAICGGQSSPYELRFCMPFKIKRLYPFGSKVFYKLMLEDANAKGRQFCEKGCRGSCGRLRRPSRRQVDEGLQCSRFGCRAPQLWRQVHRVPPH